MDNHNLPRDLQTARQAQPQEQAFQDNNVFATNGIGFQGAPQFESYNVGNENNTLDSIGRGAIQNQGVNMGGLDSASLYPVSDPFADQVPAYETPNGFDSMRGINYHSVQVGLLGENMYYNGVHVDEIEVRGSNSHPLLQGYSPINTDE